MFDHLFAEVSVAAGIRVPRYALWLELHDLGWNPDTMTNVDALAFVDGPMASFFVEHSLWASDRELRRLRRMISRFNPDCPTPMERFEAWGQAH